jgi:hypothetical protein
MHFCQDELFAIMALIPFMGVATLKLKTWWHKKHACHCHHNETKNSWTAFWDGFLGRTQKQ